MADCMNFPKKPMDFIKYHSWEDKERIYTNGGELVTVFRVEQMLNHYMPNHAKDNQTNADRIRAMSDEELAAFLQKIENGHEIIGGDYFYVNGIFKGVFISSNENLTEKVLKWLQKEVEE